MVLVKICGLQTAEAALQAVSLGADLLGVIMVPNRKRTAERQVVARISEHVRQARATKRFPSVQDLVSHMTSQTWDSPTAYADELARLIQENGPFLVGVFRNQDPAEVFAAAEDCGLDFVQLHGSEDVAAFTEHNQRRYGLIKRYVLPDHVPLMAQIPEHNGSTAFLALLDSEAGGEGQKIDWTLINGLDGRFVLAGGLNADNLAETGPYLGTVHGFDVSGGVEDALGEKDLAEIDRFVRAGKALSR